jgi:hypothetical protein
MTKVQHDTCDCSVHGFAIDDVARYRQCLATRQLNFSRDGCQGLFPSTSEGNLCAFGSERQRTSTPDSRSATGDERYFSRKSLHPGAPAARLMCKRPGSESSIQASTAQANAPVAARSTRLLQYSEVE